MDLDQSNHSVNTYEMNEYGFWSLAGFVKGTQISRQDDEGQAQSIVISV